MKTIMFVEDEDDVRESVRQLLTKWGYKALVADSGYDCLKKLKTENLDLILLDIMMPGMDGWDTCAKIKADKKTENIPIIFLTAKTDPISTSMGRIASSDYITKPFDINDLKKRVESALNKSKK